MSKTDEHQIHEHLRRLSQIEPTQEATNRAVQQVRDILTKQHEKSRLKLLPTMPKLAAAAILLIGAGFLAGRLSGPESVDIGELENSLRLSLEPSLRQSLLKELDNGWQSAFQASCVQLKDELQQQVRRDLMQFAAQTLAASGTQTEQQLRELIQLIEAARIQDRRNIEAALEHLESQFGNGLVTLAARTSELQRLEQN
ncbi:MAG: hypothetical protein JSW66_15865 [Phycisphaerales bacterium]|nr:MAG: hypothetical protein JSW66_15865 [Phycisphaerales bacterium]